MDLEDLRNNYRDDIIAIAAQYNAEDIRVFGSFARGEARKDSDIDLLVHFKKGASLLDESGLSIELHDLLGRDIDIIGDDVIRSEFKPFIFNEAQPL